MKGKENDLIKALYEIGSNAENCISLLLTAFIYNSSKPLKECCETVEAIRNSEQDLTKKMVESAKENPELKPYVSVPVHLLRIGENIEKLAGAIEKKINIGILFSDRAVTETTFVLQRLSEILKPMLDIILAKNIFLNKYVQESAANLSKNATEYATMHEERLITGECLPVASSIYINMLDAIKNIAWHAKEISSKVVESKV